MLRLLMQIVIWSESCLGILLNLFVLYSVISLSDKTLQHYKFCLFISTIQSICFSVINFIVVMTHIIDEDAVFISLNGLILYFSDAIANISMLIWVALAGTSWTILPATFILQHSLIARGDPNDFRRRSNPTWAMISKIYLLCFILTLPLLITSPQIFMEQSLKIELDPIVREYYSLTPDEKIMMYGGTLFPRENNANRSFAVYTFVGVGFTFSCSFAIVIFCVIRIRKALEEQTADNVTRTSKSLAVQRQFTKMITLQATVPFFFIGVSVGIFTVAGLFGIKLGYSTLIISTLIAAVPAVQGILYTANIHRKRINSIRQGHTTGSSNVPVTSTSRIR